MITREVPICQIHGDELRIEYYADEDKKSCVSGFCFKCAKHYRLCGLSCLRRAGHEGDHIDCCGRTWKTSDEYRL